MMTNDDLRVNLCTLALLIVWYDSIKKRPPSAVQATSRVQLKLFKIVKATETAEKEARDLHKIPATQTVHAMNGMHTCPTNAHRVSCKGNLLLPSVIAVVQSTKPQNAKFKDSECNFCKKKKHTAKYILSFTHRDATAPHQF